MLVRDLFVKGAVAVGVVLSLAVHCHSQELNSMAEVDSEKIDTVSTSRVDAERKQESSDNVANKSFHFADDFVQDQARIWTSPLRLRFSDATWLVPTAGIIAGLFVTDAQFSRHLSNSPATLKHYNNISNVGAFGLAAGAGTMWLLSYKNHNSHWRETGLLATQAAMHSLLMTETLKYSFGRMRPNMGDGSGSFFQGGTSFPSEHAAAVWSIASVIAHEYPGPLTKVLVYGAASLVTVARVRAKEHFPSDVVVGALIGQLTAYEIYKRHHDPELGGDAWESISTRTRDMAESNSPSHRGSPYVPLDSWIYPALERLAAMGLVHSQFLGMRPWTRSECARLLTEIAGPASEFPVVQGIYTALLQEFQPELESWKTQARLESIYFRTTQISGLPISGYDFGQTIINDFGRPYEQGTNFVSGSSFWATSGPWVAYVRGEYESSPSAPPLSLAARQFMALSQFLRFEGPFPAVSTPSVSRFNLLEAYVGVNLSNWQITFGNQSIWWGPGEGGSMLMSTNAAPMPMIRINRVSPFTIPFISKFLGPMKIELFFARLSGQNFVNGPTGIIGSYANPLTDQPFLHGQKISFKPTPNFEFGFSRTTIMGGPGVPLTIGTFKHSLLSLANGLPGTPQDPGDRRSAMDWTYRLPKLRNWVTFYGDAFTDDQFSPIAYWDRSAISAGLYISQFPKLPKFDLRVEGVYTDVPAGGALSHGFFYFNSRFLDGYANDGNLIGSWIGRESQGAQAWTNYWLSPRTRFQLNFRHQKVSQQYIPGGGTLTDFEARTDFTLRKNVQVMLSVQHERWLFPILQPGVQRNIAATVGIEISPVALLHKSPSGNAVPTSGGTP